MLPPPPSSPLDKITLLTTVWWAGPFNKHIKRNKPNVKPKSITSLQACDLI